MWVRVCLVLVLVFSAGFIIKHLRTETVPDTLPDAKQSIPAGNSATEKPQALPPAPLEDTPEIFERRIRNAIHSHRYAEAETLIKEFRASEPNQEAISSRTTKLEKLLSQEIRHARSDSLEKEIISEINTLQIDMTGQKLQELAQLNKAKARILAPKLQKARVVMAENRRREQAKELIEQANILLKTGQIDSARAILKQLDRKFPKWKKPRVGPVTLFVLGATGISRLQALIFSFNPDPYFQIIQNGNMLFRSKVAKSTTIPVWNESIKVDFDQRNEINIELLDHRIIGKDISLYVVKFPENPQRGFTKIRQAELELSLAILPQGTPW
jgi:hypothetical protein